MASKQWYLSRTVWFNAITLILFVIALPSVIQLIPVSAAPYIGIVNSIGNYVLRVYFTSTPIGSSNLPISS